MPIVCFVAHWTMASDGVTAHRHTYPNLCSMLVRMEKYRWNAERTVAGWKRAKVKDKVFLLHPLIMPFSELLQRHPEEVEKDADVIYNLPYILALGGYELYKLADQ